MTDPFIGEVQIFAFPFAPSGWALANGAMLQVRQSSTLFALIGTLYGGDGVNTFQLPNFANRAPCNQGQGLGLSQRTIGETFGENAVTLIQDQIPRHTHTLNTFSGGTKQLAPATGGVFEGPTYSMYLANTNPNTTLAPTALTPTGNSQPHANVQPFLAVNFCIALQGPFPSFN